MDNLTLLFNHVSGLWPWVYSANADGEWVEEKIKDAGLRALRKVADKESEIIVFRRDRVPADEPQSKVSEI